VDVGTKLAACDKLDITWAPDSHRLAFDEFYYDADTYDAPGVITHQHLVFTAIGRAQTRVVEHLTFEAPAQYIDEEVQGGAYAHQLVQQGLKTEIEAGELDTTSFDQWLEDR
jgi:hypothetical protein